MPSEPAEQRLSDPAQKPDNYVSDSDIRPYEEKRLIFWKRAIGVGFASLLILSAVIVTYAVTKAENAAKDSSSPMPSENGGGGMPSFMTGIEVRGSACDDCYSGCSGNWHPAVTMACYSSCATTTCADIRGGSACKDVYSSCSAYKQEGYCQTTSEYYGWMFGNCARTCGLCCKDNYPDNCPGWKEDGFCTATTTKDWMSDNCGTVCEGKTCACLDLNGGCPSWEELGYCQSTSIYYGYMVENCITTCGFCGTAVRASQAVRQEVPEAVRQEAPPLSADHEERSALAAPPNSDIRGASACTDELSVCPTWADAGFCLRTSEYYSAMFESCAMSCGGCCEDSYDNCPSWQELGYCEKDYVEWMSVNCKVSCNTCPCSDKRDDCTYWQQQGYCQSTSQYYGYMVENCITSCGFCGTAVRGSQAVQQELPQGIRHEAPPLPADHEERSASAVHEERAAPPLPEEETRGDNEEETRGDNEEEARGDNEAEARGDNAAGQ